MTYQLLVVQTDQRLIATPRLRWRSGYGWSTLASFVALLLFALFTTPAQARSLAISSQRTIPSGNFHLEPGQKIDEDVIVFSGNVTLEEDSQITGDLIVMSGNIEIGEGAIVEGDVATFSGNIDLFGHVKGDMASVSGNVKLYNGAEVEGDISIVSGNLDREENTEVEGDIVSGQNFDIGKIFGFASSGIANDVTDEIRVEIEKETADERTEGSATDSGRNSDSNSDRGSGSEQRSGRSFGSIIGGIFGALVSALSLAMIAGLVALIRPTLIKSVQERLRDELALCFGVGLVVNIGVFLVAGVMAITIIGLLVAIPTWVALFCLNIVGGLIASAALGERIGNYLNLSGSYALKIAVGAAIIILSVSLLWSMGSCFSFIAFIGLFLLSSIGTGALILPWVRRFTNDDRAAGRSRKEWSQSDKPFVRTGAAAETASEEFDDAESDAMDPSDTDASIAYSETSDAEMNDGTSDSLSEFKEVADVPETKPQKQTANNFTKIRGIGVVFAARLADANITSYAQLAAMSAEEIGEIFGWPAERVERDDIIEQAAALADG